MLFRSGLIAGANEYKIRAPLSADAGKSGNPQTFNRYVHALNDPMVFVDSNGLYPVYWDGNNLFSKYQYRGFYQYDGPPIIVKASNGYYYNVSKDEMTRTKSWRRAERTRERQASSVGGLGVGDGPPRRESDQSKPKPYVNNALIDSLAHEGPKHEAIMFAAAGAAGLIGGCVALCPAAAGAAVAEGAAAHATLGPALSAAVDFSAGFLIGTASEKLINGTSETDPASESYPPNDGFLGQPVPATLQPGTLIDRYGSSSGRYFSPAGTPFENRSLPSELANSHLTTYVVAKPLPVNSGPTAPWFNQPGMGTQYQTHLSTEELIRRRIIIEVER